MQTNSGSPQENSPAATPVPNAVEVGAAAAAASAAGAASGARGHVWRRRSALGLLYLLALLLGVGSAWWAAKRGTTLGLGAGAWRVSLLAGSPEADAYTRARVALGGLLALNRDETMYYVALQDSAGKPLRAQCNYRVRGANPPARWWSITAYADDLFLIANEQRRYSVNGHSAPARADGQFEFFTGPKPPSVSEQTWLPTPNKGGLVLTLRVYQPSAQLQAAPQSLAAPTIEAVGDCP